MKRTTILTIVLMSATILISNFQFANAQQNYSAERARLVASVVPASVVTSTDESAHSDKFTGGRIERATLKADEPDIAITVDVPAFRLTLWQNNKEVRSYPIGVGRAEFPISIGEREAMQVIWNPAWVPPDSSWVRETSITPLEPILAGDPRNPLGKVKIPLGAGYLIHQARKITDLGNLVSHGCIRMLQRDVYDLAEKIVTADGAPITRRSIELAKRNTKQLVGQLDLPLPVDINYDTQVIENNRLHIYFDIYNRNTNTIANLRRELETSGVEAPKLTDATLQKMLDRPTKNQVFVVPVASLKANRALTDGRLRPLLLTSPLQKTPKRN